jgi:hypothetical protein
MCHERRGEVKSTLAMVADNSVIMLEILVLLDIPFEIEQNAITCYLGHVVFSISRMSTIIEKLSIIKTTVL